MGIVEYERFLEDDEITLSAKASDDDGSISKVEFYCNGKLITGAVVTEKDEFGNYSFNWTDTTASKNYTDYIVITAIAYDNDGATSVTTEVGILIYDLQAPTLSISVADKFYDNVGGAKVDMVKVTGKFADADGTVEKIEIYIDGELKGTLTDGLNAEFSFDDTDEYAPGAHTVKVVATDNDGKSAEVEKAFTSLEVAKVYPAFHDEPLTDRFNKGKWEITEDGGKVEFDAERGMVITSSYDGTTEAYRVIGNAALAGRTWQIDVTVRFDGTSNTRTVKMLEKKLISFNDDGTITSDLVALEGKKYAANTNYTVSLIGNPSKGYMACLLNGEVIKDRISVTTSEFSSGVKLALSQDGTDDSPAEMVVSTYGGYNVGEPATGISANIFEEDGSAANLSAVSVTPGYITVGIDGGISEKVNLLDVVQLIDNVTGRACALELVDNKLMVKETLAYGSSYTIQVSTGLYNAEGKTYPGTYNVNFTTEVKEILADRTNTEIALQPGEDEDGGTTYNFEFNSKVKNDSDSPKTVYVFCVVYEGNKMIEIKKEEAIIPAGGTATPVSATTPVAALTDNTTATGFILEEDELTTVTDEIYTID